MTIVARVFAGCFHGFMGLEQECKPKLKICLLLIDALITKRITASDDKLVEVKRKPVGNKLASHIQLSISDELVSEVYDEPSTTVSLIYHLSKELNYDCAFDAESRELHITVKESDTSERSKGVFVTQYLPDDPLQASHSIRG